MIFMALSFYILSAHAQPDGRHHLFRIKRKIVFHNPVIIWRLRTENILHTLTLVLAKHEDFLAFLIEDNLSRQVSVLMMRREFGELFHIVGRTLRFIALTILIIHALIFIQHSTKQLSEFSAHHKNADLSGQIIFDEEGKEVFMFGKYKGQRVEDIFRKEPPYYDWIMKNDFPLYTKKVVTAIRLRMGGKNVKR